MLYNLKYLYGASIFAVDGQIGRLREFYFDDQKWVIRYIVVDTGDWLHSKRVLLSPLAVKNIDWENRTVSFALTKQQIRQSPNIDADIPISRQHELELHRYFGWATYWGGPDLWAAGPLPVSPMPIAEEEPHKARSLEKDMQGMNPYLISTRDTETYQVKASDRKFGRVKDYILDPQTWALPYLVIDITTWWSQKLTLLSSQWIQEVNWENGIVITKLSSKLIMGSPSYDPTLPFNREVEQSLRDYYRNISYWKKAK